MGDDFCICTTCGVEHAQAVDLCAICADERQWVPAAGQGWTTVGQLAATGHRSGWCEVEPNLFEVTVEPAVGIGQHMFCIRTPAGVVLWDPVGFIDEQAISSVRELGPVLAITASHPHMFGTQVAWSHALGRAPVLVCEPDLEWVARPDPVIRPWSGLLTLAPGVSLHQLGGHFPGSSVVHWDAAGDGAGVLLSSDTIQANPDRSSVTFLRSYPNRIPLSATVVERLAGAVRPHSFARLYDNVGGSVQTDAAAVVQRSAQRYVAWIRGDFDALT